MVSYYDVPNPPSPYSFFYIITHKRTSLDLIIIVIFITVVM